MARPDRPDGEPSTEARTQPCSRHPNREAAGRCAVCGQPLCAECERPYRTELRCPDHAVLARPDEVPTAVELWRWVAAAPPYATLAALVANVVVYLITGAQSERGITRPSVAPLHGLFTEWQLFPYYVHDRDQYYRLVTSAFLHVSLLHLLSNLLPLVVLGLPLERLIGSVRFAAVYLLGVLGGSAAVYAAGAPFERIVGASGAVFALFGVALMLARRLELDLQWIICAAVVSFVLSFSIANSSKLDHLGGFLVGLLAGLAIGGRPGEERDPPVRWQVGGLAVIALLAVGLVAYRSATF